MVQAKPSAGRPAAVERATANVWKSFDTDALADHLISLEGDSGPAKANNNPGNLKGKDGKFLKFKTQEEGKQALIAQLNSWKSRFPDWTIHDLNSRYAPDKATGGDNPDGTVDGRDAYLVNQME